MHRKWTDPVMLSNISFLVPIFYWYYLECYVYSLHFVCLLVSSVFYHRSRERLYLEYDMTIAGCATLLSIVDNMTYNDTLLWFAICGAIVYYVFMCVLCGGRRCCHYTVSHSVWHAWICGCVTVWAYTTGKYREIIQ